MILELVEHGPLIWPTVEENDVTRTKKYAELSAAEKIQADCDMKATNIILQGLPADIYSLERECKLYDAFDKFTHIKGESLHTYYLRFTQLINDVNIYKINMEQFQVNTKFLNSLPPEWRDDPIACLNKAMAFLRAVTSSRVTVQQVQRRQGKNYSGNTYKGNATSSKGNTTSRQARVVKCFNCQGEGHMARQCTQPKRQRNATWYKEKAMLVEAQEARHILDEEKLAFLADPGIPAGQAQIIIPHNATFH
uniref:CCHC-type domain-containing protein n=1 Tax=Tanacetum cinerariifolium TaxID=118510 RepID=A0A699H242_TANCI|nr:hypothetical protein [Tanacetum cinerariifolium]